MSLSKVGLGVSDSSGSAASVLTSHAFVLGAMEIDFKSGMKGSWVHPATDWLH